VTRRESGEGSGLCRSRVSFDQDTRRKPLVGAADAAMEKERWWQAQIWIGFLADSGDAPMTTAEFCRCAGLTGPLGMAI
jgi:hypothetical protein